MRIYDATRPLSSSVPTYPGDPPPSFRSCWTGGYRVTRLEISSHEGTHIDAPAHCMAGGKGVDEITSEVLIGECRVLEIPHASAITPVDISACLGRERRILLKTPASFSSSFGEAYPHLSLQAAEALVRAGCLCIGIDSPSVEAYDGDGRVHRTLLGNGVAILELLDLSGIPEGEYRMIALPLRLEQGDGAPCRVLLMEGGVTGCI